MLVDSNDYDLIKIDLLIYQGELDQEVNIEELETYAKRKNYFNGLLHLALLIASTTQLLNCYKNPGNPFPITFLCASMVLQLIVGVLLILDHRMRIKTKKDFKLGTRYTISMTTLIFFAVVLNMLFTGFELFGLK